MTAPPRNCLVLFVDISGSSRLYQQLGDDAAHRRVQACLDLLRGIVVARAGRVVKNIGDGLFCEFPDADPGLLAAEAMHSAIDQDRAQREVTLGIHVACHFGPVIETAGDLYGDTVNIAARVLDLAREGQIIITQDTALRLSEALQRNVRLLHGVHIRGRRDPVQAMDYIWRKYGDFTAEAPAPHPPSAARLKLQFDGRVLWLDGAGLSVVRLGRGIECHIIVSEPEASRLHATIEARGDRFVLMDHSSNGTYLAFDEPSEVCLKREEIILPPRGRIALGVSTTAAHATVVAFAREQ
jgi:class 3 adenylate cyclase